ncbi:MAG TPA: rod shape-determining protein MreD [Polyangiaceae bacterium LLY-WYZ-14_1]|nr:rod shape-determining protein MreD [Polyangiaceae bacterium LLY-WYZ-14_1]
MKHVAHVLLGFALLVLQSSLGTLWSLHPFSPNLLLPMVIFYGVTPEVSVVRGAVLGFALGYILDIFCGNPMGLQTFLMVATYLVAKVAGLRLFLRGPAFQMLLTFVVGVLDGGTILALRAIFEPPPPFPAASVETSLSEVFGPALVTALVAPPIFGFVRRVEQIGSGSSSAGSGRSRDIAASATTPTTGTVTP